jgi:hypothetical protein
MSDDDLQRRIDRMRPIVAAAQEWRLAYDAWLKGDDKPAWPGVQRPYETGKFNLRKAVIAFEKDEHE